MANEQDWYAVALSIKKDGGGWTFEYGVILDVLQATSAEEAKGKAAARTLRENRDYSIGGMIASRVPPETTDGK